MGYWKVYADNDDAHGNPAQTYSRRGVCSKGDGCLAIIRPDGYVGLVCTTEDVEAVDMYFSRFIPAVDLMTGTQMPAVNGN